MSGFIVNLFVFAENICPTKGGEANGVEIRLSQGGFIDSYAKAD